MNYDYPSYRLPLKNFFIKLSRKKNWTWGENIATGFAKEQLIILAWETVSMQKENVEGYECQCSGLGLIESEWHGTKQGAKNRAGWKWLERLFICTGADIEIFNDVLRRFSTERFDNVYFNVQQANNIKCVFCKHFICIEEYSAHLEGCAFFNCENCDQRIKKIDQLKHFLSCERQIIELPICPFCKSAFDLNIFNHHVQNCASRSICLMCRQGIKIKHET